MRTVLAIIFVIVIVVIAVSKGPAVPAAPASTTTTVDSTHCGFHPYDESVTGPVVHVSVVPGSGFQPPAPC